MEVKYKHLKQDTVPASLRRFIEKYYPECAYVINLSLSKTRMVRKTTLIFLPIHEVLRPGVIL